jgi:hypothetical protein
MEDLVKNNVEISSQIDAKDLVEGSVEESQSRKVQRHAFVDNKITRKQRRAHLQRNGMLKKKSKLKLNDWSEVVNLNIRSGKNIHIENERIWRTSMEEQLQTKETAIRKTLAEVGHDKEYINATIEKWFDRVIK